MSIEQDAHSALLKMRDDLAYSLAALKSYATMDEGQKSPNIEIAIQHLMHAIAEVSEKLDTLKYSDL